MATVQPTRATSISEPVDDMVGRVSVCRIDIHTAVVGGALLYLEKPQFMAGKYRLHT